MTFQDLHESSGTSSMKNKKNKNKRVEIQVHIVVAKTQKKSEELPFLDIFPLTWTSAWHKTFCGVLPWTGCSSRRAQFAHRALRRLNLPSIGLFLPPHAANFARQASLAKGAESTECPMRSSAGRRSLQNHWTNPRVCSPNYISYSVLIVHDSFKAIADDTASEKPTL